MDEPQVRALVADILGGIAPEADLASVGDGEDLRDALDLDSMDFLNLVTRLAQRSGIDVPEADAPRLFTLAGIVRYFAAR